MNSKILYENNKMYERITKYAETALINHKTIVEGRALEEINLIFNDLNIVRELVCYWYMNEIMQRLEPAMKTSIIKSRVAEHIALYIVVYGTHSKIN